MGTCKTKGVKESIALTPEESAILKSLQDKAAKIMKPEEDRPAPVNTSFGVKSHDQYKKVMRGLWGQ
jgi:hypothetical protein